LRPTRSSKSRSELEAGIECLDGGAPGAGWRLGREKVGGEEIGRGAISRARVEREEAAVCGTLMRARATLRELAGLGLVLGWAWSCCPFVIVFY
jgi:hypothetical protein